jgi:Holliday junction resolvase RusA-like endonuclease
MNAGEKLRFQKEIAVYMRASKRRSFRGPVALQMDFYPRKGNPPSIHQLAKNYLDLLWRPVDGFINPILPLQDDRQVNILIVNYQVQQENEKPSIQIKIAPLHHFHKDIRLYGVLRAQDGFPEDEDVRSYDPREIFNDDNWDMVDELDRAREQLREIEDFRKFMSTRSFEDLKRMHLIHYQSAFFKLEKRKTHYMRD